VYEIAFHLKMSVSTLLAEMTYEELLGWYNYFEKRPYGWRDDDRAAKIIQAQGVKEKAVNLFPALKAIYNPPTEGFGANSFKASMMFHKMLGAKGGDKLNL
jgi:hypothetical protein